MVVPPSSAHLSQMDMVVQNVYPPPDLNNNIKMEALGTGTPLGTIGHLILR
jgi:hypothetical protein